MAHFATLKDIKVDTRVTITFHLEKKTIKPSKFLFAVGRFMEEWGAYLDDWKLEPREENVENVWRFSAELIDVPALSYGPEVSMFMRGAENWERDKDFDKWRFSNNMELADELANYHFNDFAFWCGYADPEKLSFEDTGFEVECGSPYVTEMKGFVPIADGEPLSELEEARMKNK